MEDIFQFLARKKKIVLTSHTSPDGDAIGSSLGLYHYLKAEGHQVSMVVPNGFAGFLKWMPGVSNVLQFDKHSDECKALISAADLIFCLDYNELGRLGPLGEILKASKVKKAVIDHHLYPDDFADWYFSDSSCCSTAQLVYDFILKMGGKKAFNLDIAKCLYTGIVTDTGSFRFSSVDSHTHEIAAHFLSLGLRQAEIHEHLFDSNTMDRLRLMGYTFLNKMEIIENTHTIIISLSNEELSSFNYQKGDTEGLVNYGLSIDGVNTCIFVREDGDVVKMSFRSIGDIAVNEIARDLFGGGGHKNAAGAKSSLSMAEVLDTIKTKLTQ